MKSKLGLAVMFFAISSLLLGSGAIGTAHAAPAQGTLYGLDSFNNGVFTVNPVTGVAGPIIPINDDNGTPGNFADDFFIGLGMPSLAVDSTGTLYLGTGTGIPDLYILNPITGEAAYQCTMPLGGPNGAALEALAFDSNDNLFASMNLAGGGNAGGTDLVEIDTNCNVINGPFNYGLNDGMGGLAFDSADTLYGTTTKANGQLFTINTANGNPTPVGNPLDQSGGVPLTLTGGVGSLQFDCTGVLFGGTAQGGFNGPIGQSDLVTINTISGAASVVGTGGTLIGASMGGLAFDSACPDGLIGGELIPVNTAALLVAGAQSSVSWMVALAASVVGIGALIIKKKFI